MDVALSPAELQPALLAQHVQTLTACTRCPAMHRPAVAGGPVVSRILLVGQAPGDKEPTLGRPFAWTAGRMLFRWWHQAVGWSEAEVRARVYFAAVCRCFPGKKSTGGDRVPSPAEIEACAPWLAAEFALLQPQLVIPVGQLAIRRFLPPAPLEAIIGQQFPLTIAGRAVDCLPLPHPSGASPWPRLEPGRSLLQRALHLLAAHPAVSRHGNGFDLRPD